MAYIVTGEWANERTHRLTKPDEIGMKTLCGVYVLGKQMVLKEAPSGVKQCFTCTKLSK